MIYMNIFHFSRKEINSLLKVFMINTFIDIVGVAVSKVSFFLLILIYMSMGFDPSTETIYYIMQIFGQLASSIGTVLPSNLSKTAQVYASVIRLNEMLQAEEMDKFESTHEQNPIIFMKNLSFDIGDKKILSEVSMRIENSGLIVVTGPVGCGKSSLLKIILRDYQPILKGE